MVVPTNAPVQHVRLVEDGRCGFSLEIIIAPTPLIVNHATNASVPFHLEDGRYGSDFFLGLLSPAFLIAAGQIHFPRSAAPNSLTTVGRLWVTTSLPYIPWPVGEYCAATIQHYCSRLPFETNGTNGLDDDASRIPIRSEPVDPNIHSRGDDMVSSTMKRLGNCVMLTFHT
mmetsp:Transcript_4218/g.9067  ORF Transcript_4218/g.9067 Transcript_4218/m.9067 type:complete len:171 (-) Transcript_4218:5881-6393(-)